MNRPSRLAVALATALLLMGPGLARAQVNLPALGDAVSQDLDVNDERRIGDQIMRQIRLDPDYLDDPLLLDYVQRLWSPLVSSAKQLGQIGDDTQQRFAWEIFLVRDRSVNAFALPGGFVGVHLGLIAMTSAPDELASVLGHELSHITQRHIARRLAGDSRNSLLATAGLIAGLLAASRAGNMGMANAAIVGSQAAAAAASLSFSRDMEREADRVGFNVMVQAGYAPSGMASMFERMEQAYNLMDSGSYPYLRSHPLTSERIGEARARLGTAAMVRPHGLAEHALMAARSRVLMDARAEAWAQLQNLDAGVRTGRESSNGGNGFEQLGARYASALASIKMRDFGRADSALRSAGLLLEMLGSDPRSARVLTLARAELALAREQGAAGLVALEPLAQDKSRTLQILRAQLALVDSREEPVRQAAETLQTHVSLVPQDALAWALLAQLWQRLGQPLRAVRALGETRAAVGDLNGAIDRLRSGLLQSRGRDADQIEASVIDARLRSLLYERRQLLAELYPNGPPRGAELPQLQGRPLTPRLAP